MVIASMAAWFTPTILFCVLNLVIATIFIASNFKSPHDHDNNTPGQLARAPSLLQRVKSVNLSSFYTTPESETTGYNSTSQLSRAPSLLERVKSIDFSFSSFHATTQPEQTHNDSPSQLARAPSLLERVKSINFSSFYNLSEQLNDSPTPANGVKSFKVSGDPDKDSVLDHLGRPATMKASIASKDESVDAKADDFINRFKQQLKLQRLDSIARLKEMLNRGT